MPKKTNNPIIDEELAATEEAEVVTNMNDEYSNTAEAANVDDEEESALVYEKGAGADAQVPVEVEAMHIVEPKRKSTKNSRSIKYRTVNETYDKSKFYALNDAIELTKKNSTSNFDGTIELHIKLIKKNKKGLSESTKGVIHLPSGSVKQKKVVVLDEAMIDEIAKTKKADFDVAIATPYLMPKIGKIAKILGPQGKMPDPKMGTVTTKPEDVIKELSGGRVDYRIDSTHNVHFAIGKVSWEGEKTLANAKAVIGAIQKNKIETATVAPTHGPSVKVDLTSI